MHHRYLQLLDFLVKLNTECLLIFYLAEDLAHLKVSPLIAKQIKCISTMYVIVVIV